MESQEISAAIKQTKKISNKIKRIEKSEQELRKFIEEQIRLQNKILEENLKEFIENKLDLNRYIFHSEIDAIRNMFETMFKETKEEGKSVREYINLLHLILNDAENMKEIKNFG